MPVISSTLRFRDRAGAWKARWGIGRMSYLVPPGLYAIGTPGPADPVAVTANYKMSYDLVRQAMAGRDIWLLVLETYGINVWCAAGKGTFGTGELVRRLEASGLARVVTHRTILLPLLGAPGVKAQEVRQRTGFTARFTTIRIEDLPLYLDNGQKATPAMGELTFTAGERLVLVPVELVSALKVSLPILAVLYLLAGMAYGFTAPAAFFPLVVWLGGVIAGAVVTPVLLPWLPTPSFAVKGALAGLLLALLFAGLSATGRRLESAALFLVLPAVSAFFSLNFTGSTPFTSRSGVKKEMRISLPLMAVAVLAGVAAWVAGMLAPLYH
ncbi:acetyl-CoA synthase subunit gamma [Geobacter luticola]|uniref:Acetyl-CoA synthase subunit gamma n=1 Tax=Geomobilimonas luticola TaxID=1114878 RepID=A0ABS5SG73_9BACT|nr:acetyl-CoA synthase subunit gamma [Geomobilimonas luticola]